MIGINFNTMINGFITRSLFLKISSPTLTAADIIQYEKEIGGLNRACTVLNDLTELLDFTKTPDSFFKTVSTATIQRLGYLLENAVESPTVANQLYEKALQANCSFQTIPLKIGKTTEEKMTDRKWKIIINTKIEIDE